MWSSIWNVVSVLGMILVLMVVLELLNLPDWLHKKLRGTDADEDLHARLRAIEERLTRLEERLSQKG